MRLPTQADLVEAARRRLRARNDKHLAHLLWTEYGLEADQPKVSRWRREVRSPNYEATMALLLAAGWLDEEKISRGQKEAGRGLDAALEEEERTRLLREDARARSPERKTGTG